jgi:ribosomal protein L31
MPAMRSTDFRAVVEPVLNEIFDGVYDQRKDEWKDVFTERNGTPRAYHEEPVLYGFGSAPELPDGEAVTYSAGGTLYIKRYTYKVYGLAFALTKVLIEDGDHIRIGKVYSEHLAQSMVETKETLTANILNRAFNSTYKGGDNVELCSASHPIVGGTMSNIGTAAALSQTSARADDDSDPHDGRRQRQEDPCFSRALGGTCGVAVPGRSHSEVGTAFSDCQQRSEPDQEHGASVEGSRSALASDLDHCMVCSDRRTSWSSGDETQTAGKEHGRRFRNRFHALQGDRALHPGLDRAQKHLRKRGL